METLPVYLNYVEEDEKSHICIGVNPETLCGSKSIISVVPVEEPQEESTSDLCEECLEKYYKSIDHIIVEPTIVCDRCSYNYSSYEARSVDSMVEDKVPVCKPCYEELVNSDDSGVCTDYENSEPWKENNSSREFIIPEDLKEKFKEIEQNL